jgi:vitamin B12 transporter
MKFPFRFVSCCFAWLLLFSNSSIVWAQKTASNTLPETVVSASLIEQAVEDAIPATVLIKREDIERSGAVDLPTLLRQFAGVEVSQNGGYGTNASVFIRGSESRHTLVIVDGIPINNLNFNTTPIEAIPLFGIERIEVVRGNVSALYGSSAMGGVIQIFTRSDMPKDWAQARFEVGGNQLASASWSGGKTLENGVQIKAGLERFRTSGFNAIRQDQRPGTNPDRDGSKRDVAQVQISQKKEDLRWSLSMAETRLLSQYDSEFGPVNQADESKYKLRHTAFSSEYDLSKDTQFQLGLGRYIDNLDAYLTSDPYAVFNSKDQLRLGINHRIAPQQTLTAGYEKTWQAIASPTTAYTQTSRTGQAIRAGYQFNGEQHVVQLNVRQDDYQGFAAANTYYAGYQYFVLPNLRLLVSQSTGFSVPTFNDLYYPATTYAPDPTYGYPGCFMCYGGNVNLKPETSRSNEAGFQWGDERQTLRVVAFRNKYSNLIADNPDNPFNRINIGAASNLGQEITYKKMIQDGAVRLTWVHQNPKDDATNTALLKRAAHFFSAGYSEKIDAWQVETSARYTGQRHDRYQGTDEILQSYWLLDVAVSRPITRQTLWYGRIDNVTNKDYSPAYGYHVLRRTLITGLRISL